MRQIFRSAWKDFKTRFQHILDDLCRHRTLIESQANLVQIQQSQRDYAQLQLSFSKIEEAERKEKTLAIINWLSSADVALDQEAAEAAQCEHPGSGSWVFENEIVKPWIDPNNSLIPYVWLLGIPGAGKNISLFLWPNL